MTGPWLALLGIGRRETDDLTFAISLKIRFHT
jgi:hypothetical protein